MKITFFSILSVFAFVTLISCGGSSVEVTPEMQGFMDAINSSKSMDTAAEGYGYTSDDIPLGFYELKDPTVTGSSVDGDTTCYDVNIKHGIIDSDVKVCWSDGKITSITDNE